MNNLINLMLGHNVFEPTFVTDVQLVVLAWAEALVLLFGQVAGDYIIRAQLLAQHVYDFLANLASTTSNHHCLVFL
jgi:hypothetical protein